MAKAEPRTTRSLPFPNLVTADERDWKVEEAEEGGFAKVDLEKRVMVVPAGTDEGSLALRCHEMLHVIYTPEHRKPGSVWELAAEKGRVETRGTAAGLRRPGLANEEWTEGFTKALNGFIMDPGPAACAAVASVGAPDEKKVREMIATARCDELLNVMDWAADQYAADPSWGSTETVAAYLREMYEQDPPPSGGGKGDKEPQEGDDEGEGQGGGESDLGGDGKTSSKKPIKALAKPTPVKKSKVKAKSTKAPSASVLPGFQRVRKPTEPPPETKLPSRQAGEGGEEDPTAPVRQNDIADGIIPVQETDTSLAGAQWAPMRIEAPPRRVRLVKMKGGGRHKASDTGTTPKRMFREALDHKVFATRKHRPRGTVLIDCSGSMSNVRYRVEEIIKAIPAAVVAGYWGCGGYGILRIFAANGKTVSEAMFRPTGGGNDVDGPALDWLCKQRGPRIWVCDGGYVDGTGTSHLGKGSPVAVKLQQIARSRRVKCIYPDNFARDEGGWYLADRYGNNIEIPNQKDWLDRTIAACR